jgi:hypothetical protein
MANRPGLSSPFSDPPAVVIAGMPPKSAPQQADSPQRCSPDPLMPDQVQLDEFLEDPEETRRCAKNPARKQVFGWSEPFLEHQKPGLLGDLIGLRAHDPKFRAPTEHISHPRRLVSKGKNLVPCRKAIGSATDSNY